MYQQRDVNIINVKIEEWYMVHITHQPPAGAFYFCPCPAEVSAGGQLATSYICFATEQNKKHQNKIVG